MTCARGSSMTSRLSRRHLIQGVASSALLPRTAFSAKAQAQWTPGPGMPKEGPDTPKIGAPLNVHNITDAAMRAVKQIGVNHVLSGGPPMPWDAAQLTGMIERL